MIRLFGEPKPHFFHTPQEVYYSNRVWRRHILGPITMLTANASLALSIIDHLFQMTFGHIPKLFSPSESYFYSIKEEFKDLTRCLIYTSIIMLTLPFSIIMPRIMCTFWGIPEPKTSVATRSRTSSAPAQTAPFVVELKERFEEEENE